MRALANLGISYANQSMGEPAAACFLKALELNPTTQVPSRIQFETTQLLMFERSTYGAASAAACNNPRSPAVQALSVEIPQLRPRRHSHPSFSTPPNPCRYTLGRHDLLPLVDAR